MSKPDAGNCVVVSRQNGALTKVSRQSLNGDKGLWRNPKVTWGHVRQVLACRMGFHIKRQCPPNPTPFCLVALLERHGNLILSDHVHFVSYFEKKLCIVRSQIILDVLKFVAETV